MLGTAVRDFRDKVVLATKFGFDMTAKQPGTRFNSRSDNIRKVADLQTDYIDVLFQHIPDPDVPVEEVAGVV